MGTFSSDVHMRSKALKHSHLSSIQIEQEIGSLHRVTSFKIETFRRSCESLKNLKGLFIIEVVTTDKLSFALAIVVSLHVNEPKGITLKDHLGQSFRE